MSARDTLTALIAATVWGLTFIAIKFGVGEAPPFLLTALRFAFAAFPAILFVKPPKAPPALVAIYGLLIGVGQFGLLFLAIKLGMPVGLAAVVIMLQAFITILLAWLFMGETPSRIQLVAAGVAFAGICTIGSARLGGASFWPFALTVAAAGCWGAGNCVGKLAGRVDPLALIVWSSLVAPAPMLALSLVFEDRRALPALLHPSALLIACVAVLAYGGTLLSYGLWSRLLMRYPAAMVTPFALLVPVIAMIAGRLIFAEPSSAIELAGALLVMAGLGLNVLGDRLLRRWLQPVG
jgi:O-acetylserine/cysteine efflux transporter